LLRKGIFGESRKATTRLWLPGLPEIFLKEGLTGQKFPTRQFVPVAFA
jgi:hypothetical protein